MNSKLSVAFYNLFSNESRVVLLFLTNSWRYTNAFSKYSFVSKFCSCCSTSSLVVDSSCHAFVCPAVATARTSAMYHLNSLRRRNNESVVTVFNESLFLSCVQSDKYATVALDFATEFFVGRKQEWENLALRLCRIV